MNVYPLIFEPIFKTKIWGSRKLAELLDKRPPSIDHIGESWEIADLEDDQSVVANGPAKGKTLGDLVREWGTDLLGGATLIDGHFPLLIKFLDATQTLSVQVHPDAAMVARLGGRVRIKNEAWYVVDAEKDGCIYRGVRPGVDKEAFAAGIRAGAVESLMNRIPVRKGHCYYLPSGTVHALGAGVTVAEVQTPSDITYRVFDWNRVDEATGQPRQLHVAEAMECISFDTSPIKGEDRQHLASVWTSVTGLVRCESFVIERVRMAEGVEQNIPHAEMVIWTILEGHGRITCDGLGSPVPFSRGDAVLLPAGLKNANVVTESECMWLEVTVPIRSSLAGFERPDPSVLANPDAAERFVPLRIRGEDAGS